MKPAALISGILLIGSLAQAVGAASIIVAAANSTKEAKARADFICRGKNDQIKLLASLTRAPRIKTVYERNPRTLEPTECYGGSSGGGVAGGYFFLCEPVIPTMEGLHLLLGGAASPVPAP